MSVASYVYRRCLELCETSNEIVINERDEEIWIKFEFNADEDFEMKKSVIDKIRSCTQSKWFI